MVTLVNDNIYVFTNTYALFHAAADHLLKTTNIKTKTNPLFSVVLSGGNTPKTFFDLLANTEPYKSKIPWSKILFFFGDERYVPECDPSNNYYMANQHLFSKLPIPKDHIFPIPTHFTNPDEAANAYANTLRKVFKLTATQLPSFDLCYLGLGDNAHTASLMPKTALVADYSQKSITTDNQVKLAAALWVKELNMYRITLTPPIINNSQQINFIVNGSNKATAVKQVLENKYQPNEYPAQLIHNNNNTVLWFLDQAAATQLTLATGNISD